MASSNYPFNQDTAFNSFVITDELIVNAFLGTTYSQSELVPVNLAKIYKASLTDATITSLPLSQFVFITDAQSNSDWNDEAGNFGQSNEFKRAYARLYDYWKNCLIGNVWLWATPIRCPMLVATMTDVKFFESNGAGGTFHLMLNFDLTIFVNPDSPYA